MMRKTRHLLVAAAGLTAYFFWSTAQEGALSSQDPVDVETITRRGDNRPSGITNVKSEDVHSSSNVRDDAPLFVLQIGPSKTGTSTLQYFSAEAKNAQVLEEDNIYFVGHYGHSKKRPDWDLHSMVSACYSCNGPKVKECDDKWSEFEEIVNYHYSQNHSVLAVEEMLSAFQRKECEQEHLWNRLVPLLKNWRVRIVFTYRKYYEWVPSQYIQLYNPDGCGHSKRKIRDRQTWPDKGGKTIPPFPIFFDNFKETNVRNPPAIHSRWKDHFDDVWVFNMHNEGDFLRNFFCQMLPEATQMCNRLGLKQESVTRNPSSSKKLHFDMLATGAYGRGWINKSLSRNAVRQAVEEHAMAMGLAKVMDFPTYCLSPQQTETLLQRALDHESNLLPDFYRSRGEAEIKEEFAVAMEKGSFCSVDVSRVLDDAKWKKFFQRLDTDIEIKD